MVKGKYIRTPEHRQKLRLANLGKHPTEETRKKQSLARIGKPRSEETKKKISLGKMGHSVSLEAREKMRIGHLGKRPLVGRKLSEETKKKLSIACMGQGLGTHHTDETKRKISIGNTGKRLGYHTSDEQKQKLRIAGIAFWTNLSNKEKTDFMTRQRISKPQKELFFFLKQIFVDATLEYPVKTLKSIRFADIGIPSLKIDFEYDDPYWHNRKKTRDDLRDKELSEVGWVTFRINKIALKTLSQQPRFTLLESEPK